MGCSFETPCPLSRVLEGATPVKKEWILLEPKRVMSPWTWIGLAHLKYSDMKYSGTRLVFPSSSGYECLCESEFVCMRVNASVSEPPIRSTAAPFRRAGRDGEVRVRSRTSIFVPSFIQSLARSLTHTRPPTHSLTHSLTPLLAHYRAPEPHRSPHDPATPPCPHPRPTRPASASLRSTHPRICHPAWLARRLTRLVAAVAGSR